MLLLIALTLKGRITISQETPIPIPISTPPFGGGGTIRGNYPNSYYEIKRIQQEQRIRIEIEDSEIIAIVEFTLKNFII